MDYFCWFHVIGIALTAFLAFKLGNVPCCLGPFGATAVLVYGAYKAPLAQPRNVSVRAFSWCINGRCHIRFFWSLMVVSCTRCYSGAYFHDSDLFSSSSLQAQLRMWLFRPVVWVWITGIF